MTTPVRQDGPLRRALEAQGTDDCIRWTGATLNTGYGCAGTRHKRTTAHRRVWELVKGPILYGLQLDHLCRNRLCVNVRHLEVVTNAENCRRGRAAAGLDRRCRHGHLRTVDSTQVRRDGRRECRICHRERVRARQAGLQDST